MGLMVSNALSIYVVPQIPTGCTSVQTRLMPPWNLQPHHKVASSEQVSSRLTTLHFSTPTQTAGYLRPIVGGLIKNLPHVSYSHSFHSPQASLNPSSSLLLMSRILVLVVKSSVMERYPVDPSYPVGVMFGTRSRCVISPFRVARRLQANGRFLR